MKILVLIPTLGYGGAERLLVTLLPKLKNRGIEIHVCTFSLPLDLAPELEKEGISVVNLKLKHRWSIFEALIKLYKEIKKFNPDIIWGHLYFGVLYSRLVSIFFSQLKVVSVLHYNISSDSIKKGLWYSFRNWIFNKSKRFDFATVAVSQSVKKDYETFFKWNNIDIIFNAINLQKIDNAILNFNTNKCKETYNISSNDFTIILPGRLHNSKGHKYLIEAIKILKTQYQLTPKVLIVGEGSSRNEIISLISELKLNNQIILTGSLEQIELFQILKVSNMIVLPSLFEAFGIAAIESMYLEKPIIVTSIDGLKEITRDNIDAIQVPVENSDAIAKGVVKIYKDSQYAQSLAKHAKKTASKYDVNIIVEEWIKLFESEKK